MRPSMERGSETSSIGSNNVPIILLLFINGKLRFPNGFMYCRVMDQMWTLLHAETKRDNVSVWITVGDTVDINVVSHEAINN